MLSTKLLFAFLDDIYLVSNPGVVCLLGEKLAHVPVACREAEDVEQVL